MFTSITIAMYFFYSGILYLGVAVLQLASLGIIKDELCTIPGALNESAGQDIGCANCPSVSAMCTKDPCYQFAMNITYYQEAAEAADSLFQQFSAAATDETCFDEVQDAADPYEAMQGISTNADVTTDCITFHCEVFRNSIGIGAVEGVYDLMSPTGEDCSNVHGVKPEWYDSWCACRDMADRLKADLDSGNMLATGLEPVCGIDLTSTNGWAAQYTGTTTTTSSPTTVESTSSPTTPSTTPAALSTPPGGGAAARRMERDQRLVGWQPMLQEVGGFYDFESGNGLKEPDAEPLMRWMEVRARERLNAFGEYGGDDAGFTYDKNLTVKRRLTAAVSVNADYTVAEWTPCKCYMQCIPGVRSRQVNCYGGLDPTIDICNGDRPHSAEACDCDHCSDCDALFNVLIVMISFFIQGGVALLCFLVFLHYEGQPWSIAIRWNIFEKFAGFFIKNLPPIVRLLVVANFIQLLLLAVQALVPTSVLDYDSDCKTVSLLQAVSGISLAVCTLQIFFGLAARRVTRRPPWLFAPMSASLPAVLRPISRFMAALGP